MMKRRWNHGEEPKDAIWAASAISKVIGHPTYIDCCARCSAVQKYWTAPEFIVEKDGIQILTSNINPGDFFNHGKGSTQIGIVSRKLTLNGKPAYVEGLRDSIHPHDNYLRYTCTGEMGGFLNDLWHDHGLSSLTSGYFIWLPIPIQLKMAGFYDEAAYLDAITNAILKQSAIAELDRIQNDARI